MLVKGLANEPGSALNRALDPDWWVTPEVQFLREVEYHLHWLRWAKTTDATGPAPRNTPERIPLTVEEKSETDDDYTAMSLEEAQAFLGW